MRAVATAARRQPEAGQQRPLINSGVAEALVELATAAASSAKVAKALCTGCRYPYDGPPSGIQALLVRRALQGMAGTSAGATAPAWPPRLLPMYAAQPVRLQRTSSLPLSPALPVAATRCKLLAQERQCDPARTGRYGVNPPLLPPERAEF